ncbi:hypothetical protein BAE44_0015743, partial [Dichanthelium oligosanthes]
LVGRPYPEAYQIITTERPDVHVEELQGGTVPPPGPVDETRVRVYINGNLTVVPPAPTVG